MSGKLNKQNIVYNYLFKQNRLFKFSRKSEQTKTTINGKLWINKPANTYTKRRYNNKNKTYCYVLF